ncbi:hypothetical protein B0T36_22350 [Nocardia donostiensis]|uniref:hypothetical protein n=1 Tax=Nocardia donostiensis TaxID=1538463 RepID=UPI0009DB4646|nr:hypothetical protein [Nocardia donostiensis]OQS12850.1 hypothetical protein B0T36_22350 [Nocardia donostiensis]
MGLEHRQDDEQFELELVREVVLSRRRQDSMVLAALAFGAELLGISSEQTIAAQAVRILGRHAVEESDIARDPRGALRADLQHDRERMRRIGHSRDHAAAEADERRTRQLELLFEVRSDLLDLVRRCREYRFDRLTFADQIAKGLCAAADKLVSGADMDTFRAWQRGMVLGLTEVPRPSGPPRVLATVDAGPGRDPLTVEWDSCERRLALVTRMMRAGVSPVLICERLLADLSTASPLRYSRR